MSLENNIIQLNASVDALTAEMIRLREIMGEQQRSIGKLLEELDKPTTIQMIDIPEFKVAPEELGAENVLVEQKKKVAEVEEITLEDLKNICMELSREDSRKYSQKVKDIVSSYDGADLIRHVPKEKWPELKARLEGLRE